MNILLIPTYSLVPFCNMVTPIPIARLVLRVKGPEAPRLSARLGLQPDQAIRMRVTGQQ